jgi:hypothetical protein
VIESIRPSLETERRLKMDLLNIRTSIPNLSPLEQSILINFFIGYCYNRLSLLQQSIIEVVSTCLSTFDCFSLLFNKIKSLNPEKPRIKTFKFESEQLLTQILQEEEDDPVGPGITSETLYKSIIESPFTCKKNLKEIL